MRLHAQSHTGGVFGVADNLVTADGAVGTGERRRFGFGTQSKLLMMLLAVSLISAIVAGVIGFMSGRDSLQQAAFEQLTAIREVRAEAVEREFSSLQRGVQLDSRNGSAVEAAQAFVSGFDALQDSTLTESQEQQLVNYYTEEFVPELEERSGQTFSPESFVPSSPAGRYLQSKYTANRAYDDYDAGLALHDAGDGSAWSQANATYGPFFSGLITTLGYEDLLVVDVDANVVFSGYKSVDLGVNLQEEPYANSTLTAAVEEVLRSGSLDAVVTTDFERYLPSLNVPTAWVVSPIGSSTNIIGVLAVQVPIDQINAVMTGNDGWRDQGLGETGEVYLAGEDLLMRSVSRLLVEHPEQYRDTVISTGTPAAIADRVIEVDGTVQLQPVPFLGAEAALRGESGTAVTAEYTSSNSLVAYAPLSIEGLNWGIVAHIDADEAFAPVTDFTRNVVLSTLAILLLVSVLSIFLAQVFTRPVHRLVAAVRSVAAGDLSVQVPQRSRDEFGDLGAAFNEMASSLRIKQALIDEQRAENATLMNTLMPEAMAERYKQGEETISEEHDNVSVVFAELVGLDDHAELLSSQEEIAQLNSIMRGFDEAAEKEGVEKVRALRGGYLASCGLVVPRVDNVRRAVDFARDMREVVRRFNQQHGTQLDLRAGVDTGTVTSGLVARTSLAYDLWGDAVNLAYRVRAVSSEPGVFISQAAHERLQDSVPTVEAGTIELRGTTQTVWRIAD